MEVKDTNSVNTTLRDTYKKTVQPIPTTPNFPIVPIDPIGASSPIVSPTNPSTISS